MGIGMDKVIQIRKHESQLCRLTVNDTQQSAACESRTTLLDFLRVLGFQSVHAGCEHGVCGACTVMVDGLPVRSCLLLAHQCHGAEITTVESMSAQGALTDLQLAFSKYHGLQCGFCTPGILISAEAFLRQHPDPTENEVREALSAHLCRCTGYSGMVQAILAVSKSRRNLVDSKEQRDV